jgi:hypothetical protein
MRSTFGTTLHQRSPPLVKHGEWIPWLKSNFKGSQRTAYRYTELASNVTCELHMASASINEALRMIAGEDEEEESAGHGRGEDGKS